MAISVFLNYDLSLSIDFLIFYISNCLFIIIDKYLLHTAQFSTFISIRYFCLYTFSIKSACSEVFPNKMKKSFTFSSFLPSAKILLSHCNLRSHLILFCMCYQMSMDWHEKLNISKQCLLYMIQYQYSNLILYNNW